MGVPGSLTGVQFSLVSKSRKEPRLSYAFLALDDYPFPAARTEHGRAGIDEPVFVAGDRPDASSGRPAWRARGSAAERSTTTGRSIPEHCPLLGSAHYDGPSREPCGRT